MSDCSRFFIVVLRVAKNHSCVVREASGTDENLLVGAGRPEVGWGLHEFGEGMTLHGGIHSQEKGNTSAIKNLRTCSCAACCRFKVRLAFLAGSAHTKAKPEQRAATKAPSPNHRGLSTACKHVCLDLRLWCDEDVMMGLISRRFIKAKSI